MHRGFFRPKVRLYRPQEDGVVKPFDNPWDRFRWLANHKPQPSKFKVGDVCKVIKKGDRFKGKEVRVHYASGDHIECVIGRFHQTYSQKDLKWIRHSRG